MYNYWMVLKRKGLTGDEKNSYLNGDIKKKAFKFFKLKALIIPVQVVVVLLVASVVLQGGALAHNRCPMPLPLLQAIPC